MLVVTENAAAAIRDLLAGFELGAGAGLRIAADREDEGVRLAFAPAAAEGDHVVDGHGACIFVEPDAAAFLEDKVLDATMLGNRLSFAIAARPI